MARIPRPAARILLVDGACRVLLMRFTPDDRPPLW
ncbi:MAG: DNA mismatch repair protein MutT, partial [Sphingomonas sp.]